MKSLLFLLAFAYFAPAQAQVSQVRAQSPIYGCSMVDVEEWRVDIDLSRGVASFFDNDTTVYFKLVKAGQLESLPPQWVYNFEGQDRNRPIYLYFNATKGKAVIDYGRGSRESYDFVCRNAVRVRGLHR